MKENYNVGKGDEEKQRMRRNKSERRRAEKTKGEETRSEMESDDVDLGVEKTRI